MLRDAIESTDTDYHIIEAFDGVHALELLHQMEAENDLPCLIVLDINMPRMDGKQTLVALQNNALFSSLPIVLFSTSSSKLDRTFSEAKNVELLTKPLEYTELRRIANRLLSYCRA